MNDTDNTRIMDERMRQLELEMHRRCHWSKQIDSEKKKLTPYVYGDKNSCARRQKPPNFA